jgi:hypothetical protein
MTERLKTTDVKPSRDEGPLDSVVEIELALERGEVTFPMVMKALYMQWPDEDADDTPLYIRECYQRLYQPALAQFMAAHAGINESWYADEFAAGAVLTGKNELFANVRWDDFKFDTTPARALEADVNDLRLRAELYLSDKHRRICMQRLLRLYKGLFASLRVEYSRWTGKDPVSDAAPHAGHLSDLRQMRREFEGVRATYRRAGTARGQARYVAGAALGAAAIVGLAGVAAALVSATDHTIWLGALAGGAIGALLSVLERLTRRALAVRFESDRLVLSGVSRPVVGAISGVALFALIESTLVPIEVPASTTSRGLFFVGIAFLAGFSERLAKDVFGNAASSLPGSQQESGMVNESAKPAAEAGSGHATASARTPTTGSAPES